MRVLQLVKVASKGLVVCWSKSTDFLDQLTVSFFGIQAAFFEVGYNSRISSKPNLFNKPFEILE